MDNWEDGTTEPGSSGSALFDSNNQLIVGFLTGGPASCDVIDYDRYGKFAEAWDGPSADTRLRDWLDPDNLAPQTRQGSFLNAPVISVDPVGLSFLVASDATDSAPLTVSNFAASPAEDLIWSVSQIQMVPVAAVSSATGVNRSVSRPVGRRIQLAIPGQWKAESERYDHDPHELLKDSIVDDGSFETGTGSGSWTEASTNFGTPLCSITSCSAGGGTGPRTGAWWCYFGGIPAAETGSVSQVVSIPVADVASLDFYLELPACDSAADFMEVLVDGNQKFVIMGDDPACGDVGYELYSVDISEYADGGAHTLTFRSETFASGGGFSNIFLDDISINVTTFNCPWLSVTPLNGTTAQGSSSILTINVDATGLLDNQYTCQVTLASDDPSSPSITVPVLLVVGEDCNANGIPDSADIHEGTSGDIDGNGVPDECEDCNNNGFPDHIEEIEGITPDCNDDGVPDDCNIADGMADDNGNGIPDICEVAAAADQHVMNYRLHDPVPNPLNPSTRISFELPQASGVRLSVYDMTGRLVRTLVQDVRDAGRHEVLWRGVDDAGQRVSSGVYLYKLEAGSHVEARRMTLLR